MGQYDLNEMMQVCMFYLSVQPAAVRSVLSVQTNRCHSILNYGVSWPSLITSMKGRVLL